LSLLLKPVVDAMDLLAVVTPDESQLGKPGRAALLFCCFRLSITWLRRTLPMIASSPPSSRDSTISPSSSSMATSMSLAVTGAGSVPAGVATAGCCCSTDSTAASPSSTSCYSAGGRAPSASTFYSSLASGCYFYGLYFPFTNLPVSTVPSLNSSYPMPTQK